VEVAGEPWPASNSIAANNQVRVIDNAAYYLGYVAGRPPECQIFRVAFPDLTPRVAVRGLQTGPGTAILYQGQFHVTQLTPAAPGPDGRQWSLSAWWAADADGKNPRRLAASLPQLEGVWFSSHYGLVAVGGEPGKQRRLYAVEIVDPAPKK
jgi:hypothetical protein